MSFGKYLFQLRRHKRLRCRLPPLTCVLPPPVSIGMSIYPHSDLHYALLTALLSYSDGNTSL